MNADDFLITFLQEVTETPKKDIHYWRQQIKKMQFKDLWKEMRDNRMLDAIKAAVMSSSWGVPPPPTTPQTAAPTATINTNLPRNEITTTSPKAGEMRMQFRSRRDNEDDDEYADYEVYDSHPLHQILPGSGIMSAIQRKMLCFGMNVARCVAWVKGKMGNAFGWIKQHRGGLTGGFQYIKDKFNKLVFNKDPERR